MDGVTILRTYQTISDGWGVLLFFVELAILGGGAVITIWLANEDKIRAAIGVALITILVGILAIDFWPRVKRYEVLLQDGASWRDFTDHYEVLSVDGNILRVRDRTGS